MFTLFVVLVSVAFYLLYNTSKKAILSRHNAIACWAQDNSRGAKIVAAFVLSLSLGLSMTHYGFASGIFGFFVILMTVASCVVLFAPLRYVKAPVLASAFLLSLLFEFIWK
jgi:hypothetical protein